MILEYRSTALAMYELGVGEGYRDPDALKRRYFTLPTLDEESNDGNNQAPDSPLSAIRIDINMKWMNAAQELLDAVLACSTDTLRKLPNLTYTRFAMAVTSLLKIHFSVRTGALGEVVTPQTVNVAYYLEALAIKLSGASDGGKYNIPTRWYQVVGVKGQDWYDRLERRYSLGTETSVGVISVSPSTGTVDSGSGAGAASQPFQAQGQGQGIAQDTHMVQVPPSSMDSFPVPVPPMARGMDGMRDGYVAMNGGGMWPMDGHGHNAHYFHGMNTAGYQPSPSHPQAGLPQFAYEPQRMPAMQHLARAGMELDGWIPDGSIFGMPPLPEF
jgi:hypothetical protein